jgi:hypothetical protein
MSDLQKPAKFLVNLNGLKYYESWCRPAFEGIKIAFPKVVFATWFTATCRQRINAMVLTQYDLFSWNKCNVNLNSIIHMIYINYIVFVLGKIAHSVRADPSSSCRLACSSSSLSMLSLPSLSTDCLPSSLLGGLGPPSPPSPVLTPFPSGTRQHPTPILGTGK